MKNFLKLDKLSLMYQYFAYVDTDDMKADMILYRNRVHASFEFDFTKKGTDYVVVVCKVPRWEVKKFVKSMDEFDNLLALSGNQYQEFCKNLMNYIVKFEKGESCDSFQDDFSKFSNKKESVVK